jgi:hypothetical protein
MANLKKLIPGVEDALERVAMSGPMFVGKLDCPGSPAPNNVKTWKVIWTHYGTFNDIAWPENLLEHAE